MTMNIASALGLVALVLCNVPAQAQIILERSPAAQVQPREPAQRNKKKIDCSVTPDLCMTEPVALGCGMGRHWSAAGSGLSHCVDDDRDCKDGKPAKRDEFDNLVCSEDKEPEEAASDVPTGAAKK